MGFASGNFYKHLVGFFLSALSLFRFVSSFVIFRFRRERFEEKSENSVSLGSEAEQECEEINDCVRFADSENEDSFCLRFRFPTYEEFVDSQVLSTSSNCIKFEFTSRRSFRGFIEEEIAEAVNSNVEVLDSEIVLKSLSEKDDGRGDGVEVSDDDELMEFSWEKGGLGKEAENKTQADFDLSDEVLFQSEKESLVTDSDSVSIGFEQMHGLMSRLVDYYSDGFLSDHDFVEEFEFEDDEKVELHHSEMPEEKQDLNAFDQVDLETNVGKLEQDHLDNLENLASQFLSENDFHEDDDELMNGSQESSEDDKSKNEAVLDSEDANKLEPLWEHQDLIEQLQMELRKVRATGLATILEEPESCKLEDLKPWKIEESFQRRDCMGELHKFYKSYRERMRKFDILTYQKMYAIGFMQKDPLQLLSTHKSSCPQFKSLLSEKLCLLKQKQHEFDPKEKFIRELQSDLEAVYVGQMCLSWEFLNWQYRKALDLLDSDPCGFHQYNDVAGELQQFQVLMQRFLEDEPFQGTRVQHYIKKRCDSRNLLLQVPVIRDDRIKGRKNCRKLEKVDNAITIEMIVEALEESIQIFWQFVKADKDFAVKTVKIQKGVHPDVQNEDDLELLMETIKNHRKKENMLKNILRGENCMMRFKRCRNEDSDHLLCFFSQVDMKLVYRVLNMSRLTTDQLVWCHDKLSRISFVQRKICVEPSFLLFPG